MIQNLYEMILQHAMMDDVFVFKKEGRSQFNCIYSNKMSLETQDKFRTITQLFPPEKNPKLFDNVELLLRGKTEMSYEEIVTEENDKKFLQYRLSPLIIEKEEVEVFMLVILDQTLQRKTELELKELWAELHKSKKSYQSLFKHNPEAIVSVDLKGRINNCNPQIESLIGYKPVQLIGKSFYSIVASEDKFFAKSVVSDSYRNSNNLYQFHLRDIKGKKVPVSIKKSWIIPDNEIEGIYLTMHDLSEQLDSENKLFESEENLRIIIENARDLITLLNDKGKIIFGSPSYKKILGYDQEEYMNKIFLFNIHPEDQERVHNVVQNSIVKGKGFTIQCRHYKADGSSIWLEWKGTPVFSSDRTFRHMVVLSRDISEQKEYEDKLKHDALHDVLTGLPNRRHFSKELLATIEDCKQRNERLALMMLDIDNFKSINDTYGHDIGDEVIKEFGNRIQRLLGKHAMIARLGGDEFIVMVYPVTDLDKIHALAEEIIRVVQESWTFIHPSLSITTSIGVNMMTNQVQDRYLLMKQADLALYKAKELGKNQYYFYEHPTEDKGSLVTPNKNRDSNQV
ncbi:diguanylate cyclase (GGDEF)-like protein/PAS domain S-box-containing protein [Gracilibacillus halotolerans]|uniref:Diguanylate cyclase (GGDEF)-like protein/PAS domain S-box-containing protein n=1 Tax=Gracilibacillus halotolerans TaxID=74386 RepID=A0A841RLY9_9BACI|nr:diguanylate cyclase (GGDEF)-like protein/PAS domain S-box-containing protein [Gracilibacillus halotolerans]